MTLNEALCCIPQHITLKHIENQKVYLIQELLNTSDDNGYDVTMATADMWVIMKDKKPVIYSVQSEIKKVI